MKIDNECVRDILFTIEEYAAFEKPFYINGYKGKNLKISDYNPDKIAYHLRYLKMKGLIYMPNPSPSPDNYDLTPEGHEFLANVREDTNWKKIKSISSNIGFGSLKIISAIAEGVATAAINQQLGFSK